MSDYIVMVEERAKVFLGGPPLVKMATGEDADDEELGGADDARPRSRPGRLPRRRRGATRCGIGRADRRAAELAQARPGARTPSLEPRVRRRGAARHRPSRPHGAVRPARGDRPRSSTAREFDEFKPLYGTTLVTGWAAHPRLPGRHPRQRPGRAVLPRRRRRRRSSSSSPTSSRHPAAVPAQHHRLHGRQRSTSRAGSSSTARMMINAVSNSHGAAPDGDHGRLLRRRQLRHVRPGLRPALPVRLAERRSRR